ncbi:MAG: bifunctional hydroxymethylpyrimidine kinase/phosphomethylpyrimidine kinase [Actinomycetota bacterium]|nr:bifunctional hydroxymethylpyrimidine kinase/phosphomethylpyrimidine kinase [Actinomycetota bacterium]
MTIAGSDSGGGAGLQADLKTFAALGVFGTSAVTAVTAQSTVTVEALDTVAPSLVALQVRTVVDDMRPAAAKTGMLATGETVRVVAGLVADGVLPPLVVDPVLVASTGKALSGPDVVDAYVRHLLPVAHVVTPNLAEAAILVGHPVSTLDHMREAALEIAALGPTWVVVKGGHLAPAAGTKGRAVDVVWDGTRLSEIGTPFVDTTNVHGTGCTFSAAVAAFIASGKVTGEAIDSAKQYVHRSIAGAASWRLGAGHGPLDHFGWSVPHSLPADQRLPHPLA